MTEFSASKLDADAEKTSKTLEVSVSSPQESKEPSALESEVGSDSASKNTEHLISSQQVPRETRIAFLKNQYQAQQEMVVFADTKVAGLLLLNGAILLFLLSKIPLLRQVFEKYPSTFYPYVLLILLFGMILFVGASSYFGFLALIPRYIRFENKIKAPLMIFFSSVNQQYPSPESYLQALKKLTSEEIERDLSHQIVEVSYILSVKYHHIQLAAFFIVGSFPLLAIFYGFLLEF